MRVDYVMSVILCLGSRVLIMTSIKNIRCMFSSWRERYRELGCSNRLPWVMLFASLYRDHLASSCKISGGELPGRRRRFSRLCKPFARGPSDRERMRLPPANSGDIDIGLQYMVLVACFHVIEGLYKECDIRVGRV